MCRGVSLLLPMLACASSPGGMATPPARIDQVHVESQHNDYQIASKVEGSEHRTTVQFPAAAVWRVLPQVYLDLAIPIETHDPAHRFVAGATSVRRVFAGKPLSRFVDCGSTVMGPNANSHNVRLHVQTQVDSIAVGESIVRTLVNSTGASDGGNTVQCASRGDIELLIVDHVGQLVR